MIENSESNKPESSSDNLASNKDNDGLTSFKRNMNERVFANRHLLLDKIAFFGFDMDYTLAEYISPAYEGLTFSYAVKELIARGYPQEISETPYRSDFASRGVIFDKRFGYFLKVDPYGNIMTILYGSDYVDRNTTVTKYRNRFIDIGNQERYFIFNTLFEFPSIFLISVIINYFKNSESWKLNESSSGFEKEHIQISFNTIFDDVHKTFDHVHNNGDMKRETVKNIELYIKNDPRLPLLLKRIKNFGRTTFLVTNSDYWYTNNVLGYLFRDAKQNGEDFSTDWRSYFDLIVVEACKPKFFAEGTAMCEVDLKTGKKSIGIFKGSLYRGMVFSGGNSETVSQLLGAHGKDILYVGDHIFGDILKSKKKQGWRTYLVVPELLKEMEIWNSKQSEYQKIQNYDALISNTYRNMDSHSIEKPSAVVEYTAEITKIVIEIEQCYGVLGSLLRCGTRQTFFSGQLARFADIYSHTCLNLLCYPFFYVFRSPAMLLPHEHVYKSKFVDVGFETPKKTAGTSRSKKKQITKYLTVCAEEMDFDCSESSSSKQID